MNEKLSITIDVTKIPRERIVERRYTNKGGNEIIAKDLKLEVVPLKEPNKIKEGDTWEMWKTHFVALQQTKEEREGKVKSLIIGDAIMFKEKKVTQPETPDYPQEDISPDKIPF